MKRKKKRNVKKINRLNGDGNVKKENNSRVKKMKMRPVKTNETLVNRNKKKVLVCIKWQKKKQTRKKIVCYKDKSFALQLSLFNFNWHDNYADFGYVKNRPSKRIECVNYD